MSKSNKCIACRNDLNFEQILSIGTLPFYYGIKNENIESDLRDHNLAADLLTCHNCGLIQQVISGKRLAALDSLYQGYSSDVSTPMSDTGWGRERVKVFFKNVSFLFRPYSAVEIGCQNGYLLYELSNMGAEKLYGVEPSLQVPYSKNGFKAKIYKEFFNPNRFKGKIFDTVLALWVLEHTEYPVKFLKSVSKVLKKDGQLIITVPNAKGQIAAGDPGLFIHEHLGYYTETSLRNIFSIAGYRIVELNITERDYYITATKSNNLSKIVPMPDNNILAEYEKRLKNLLTRFKRKLLHKKRLGLWGACATTANLIKLSELTEYVVFDSDSAKYGNEISGINGVVMKPTKSNLRRMADYICIAPYGPTDSIKRILQEEGIRSFGLFEG
ncbi:class I SAM-dependent methyltransferase [Candidatus Omnitrophota bacterium]